MANWRLAHGLAKLRQQVNDHWPNRNKASDGAIGDPAHASRASDHNPWLKVNGLGVVTAIDITHDPATGPDGMTLSDALTRDFRSKYVIHRGRIWKARTGHWERYNGPNPHNQHVHLSIKPEHADDERTWALSSDVPAQSFPTLKRGDRGQAVRRLQEKLAVDVDGVFGALTELAVREFQQTRGLQVDGIVGPATWAALNSE